MADAFARGIAKVAIAQICQTHGFTGIQRSAADALVDMLVRYLREIGIGSKSYAELAGRIECNLNDVLLAFSDVGASVPDVMRYVEWADEVPFPRSLPRFPVKKKRRNFAPTFSDKGQKPPSDDVSDWMPVFPERHTYMSTPVYDELVTDPRATKIELGKEKRRAERALISLHRRLDAQKGGGSSSAAGAGAGAGAAAAGLGVDLPGCQDPQLAEEQASVLMDMLGAGSRKSSLLAPPPSAPSANPFLAPPRAAGERERSPPLPPLRSRFPPDPDGPAAAPLGKPPPAPTSALEAFSSLLRTATKKDDCMRMEIDGIGCEMREGKGFATEDKGGAGKEDRGREGAGGSAQGTGSDGFLPLVRDRTPVLLSFDFRSDLHRKKRTPLRTSTAMEAKKSGGKDKEERKEKEREKEKGRGTGIQGADGDEKRRRAEAILAQAETEKADNDDEARGMSLQLPLID
ncbi:hypothetical protein CBR_g23033 [Chara braunii]|uniref:Transcription initiation factor TFIID subunit 8 n=1 Tax=Chara braunii TaxID=69332 RepID=A0A388L3J2_CHABU|nr:hypothetical protein CBR_g23033 [Chara braunii]|eukprot:GBG76818.1 hypothetical protein CBR_g23033 [Chara braunii]